MRITEWKVIHDPVEDGAFSSLACFTRTELDFMLQNQSFEPGTILQNAAGKRYKVVVPKSKRKDARKHKLIAVK